MHPPATVAVVKGEDAAPEAVDAALRVVDALEVPLQFVYPTVGETAARGAGNTFPDEARDVIDDADTTFFGATSGASGIALFYLRFGKATYANVRPARWLPGAQSPLADPGAVDLVIVRENLEGLYCGIEGPLADLAPLGFRHPLGGRLDERDGSYAVKVVTDEATTRIARFAADLAGRRARDGHPGLVTIGAKHNILNSDARFVDICRGELERADVPHEDNHIDNLARRMIAEPDQLDVVLVPNLYGDILSDLAAGVIGGLGMMGSGCYGTDYAYFEPPHGTAPDLTGKGLINPTGQLLAAAMMLDHLDLGSASGALRSALARVYLDGGSLTVDQGGQARTDEFADAVIAQLDR
jgi:isocitrate/isopropylmalate dehydrogenase